MSQPPIACPAFVDLHNRLVIVVGHGPAAERKARALLKYGADIAVIGEDPTSALVQAEADGLLTLERRPFEENDVQGAFLIICVDEDPEVCRRVAAEADARGHFVSAGDASGRSSFSTPSVVRRGNLQIAISTAGKAPEVAHQARTLIKDEFGEEWAEYVEVMGRLRDSLKDCSPEERTTALEAAVASDLLDRLRQGQTLDIEQLKKEFLPSSDTQVGE